MNVCVGIVPGVHKQTAKHICRNKRVNYRVCPCQGSCEKANQGAESTGFLEVYTRAGQSVITSLRTLFSQISQVIEIRLQKSIVHKRQVFLQFVPIS